MRLFEVNLANGRWRWKKPNQILGKFHETLAIWYLFIFTFAPFSVCLSFYFSFQNPCVTKSELNDS